MNNEQLSFFRQRLEQMRDEIKQIIDSARSQIAHSEHETDPLDIAARQEMLQLNLRTTERQTRLLHKIENALARIESGAYGYCEETGEPIGIPRLLARPTAMLSIHAKEFQEMKERTSGIAG